MNTLQQKPCLQCGFLMTKKASHGQEYWDKQRKFCSRSCRNKARIWTTEMRIKAGQARCEGRNGLWRGGKSKSFLKRVVLDRDNGTCQKCGLMEFEIMDVDHVIPRRVASELQFDIKNLLTLCPNCHRRKTLEDHKKYPQKWRNQFSL